MAIKKIPINDFATAEREINTVVTLEHKNVINFYNREIDEEKMIMTEEKEFLKD